MLKAPGGPWANPQEGCGQTPRRDVGKPPKGSRANPQEDREAGRGLTLCLPPLEVKVKPTNGWGAITQPGTLPPAAAGFLFWETAHTIYSHGAACACWRAPAYSPASVHAHA